MVSDKGSQLVLIYCIVVPISRIQVLCYLIFFHNELGPHLNIRFTPNLKVVFVVVVVAQV